MTIEGEAAFQLSPWCGTCPFLFERLEGANQTLSIPALSQRLAQGLEDVDAEIVGTFSRLLPVGVYLPLLLEIQPQLRLPSGPGDYFAEEQLSTWGLDPFWGLPQYPRTAYYRTYESPITAQAHLYEFVVPMLPPAWNDRATVAHHASLLSASSTPTAVAVSSLDICAPAVATLSEDYYEHWGLTHFLLDGHHKVQAAAETNRPLRLLSLLSVDASLATPEQVHQTPRVRNQPAARR